MVTFGWLLLLGTAGITVAVIWANQDMLLGSAGVLEFLGYQLEPSVGQVFGAGAVAMAMVFFAFWMILSGLRRRSRRLAAARQIPAPRPAPVINPEFKLAAKEEARLS